MEESIFKIVSNQGDSIHVCRVQPNDAWSICDFVVSNEQRLISFFPKTREQNLTPDLSRIFTELKSKEFDTQTEYLFTLKEREVFTLNKQQSHNYYWSLVQSSWM